MLDHLFEERASERIWNVKLQYNTDSPGVAQQLSNCPQTLVELTSAKEEAAAKIASEKRTTHTFELPSEVSLDELDELLLWFKSFNDPSPPTSTDDTPGASQHSNTALPNTASTTVQYNSPGQPRGLGFAATRHITIKGAAAQPSTAAADSGITCDVTSSQTTPAPVTSVPVTADVDAAAAAAAPASQSDPPAVSSTSSDVAPSTPSNSAATTAVLAAGGPSAAAGSGSDPASAGGAAKAKQAPQGRGGNQAGGSAAAVGPKGRGQTNGRGTGAAAAGRSRNGSQIPLADQLYAWCREAGGGYLEFSRGELQELVAAGGALPPPLQQLSDLRACGKRLFDRIAQRDEAGAIAVLEASPAAVVCTDTMSTETTSTPAMFRRLSFGGGAALLQRLGSVFGLILLLVALSVMSPDFLTAGNLLTVLRQAVNIAERVHRIRRRREYQRDGTLPQPESLLDGRDQWRAGVMGPRRELLGWLGRMQVEPVFTAHPTEAVRRSLLEKEQAIERHEDDDRIYMALSSGWQTAEASPVSPTVQDEHHHVGFYIANPIYRIVPALYESLAQALKTVYDVVVMPLPRLLSFATWVGGDMDGNPNVGAATIATSLASQRALVLEHYVEDIANLARLLSQTDQITLPTSPRDNRYGAEATGLYIISMARNNKGNVIELQGVPGTSAARERGQGFDDVIKTSGLEGRPAYAAKGEKLKLAAKTLRDMVKAQKVAAAAAAVAAAAKAVVPLPAKRAVVPTSPVAASCDKAAAKVNKKVVKTAAKAAAAAAAVAAAAVAAAAVAAAAVAAAAVAAAAVAAAAVAAAAEAATGASSKGYGNIDKGVLNYVKESGEESNA
ncbi:MAG: hypothetical protein WDW36_008955 [Sanguina aurantia]